MPGWARWLRPFTHWLLVFIPASLITESTHQPLLTFINAALAIVSLAGRIGRATEQLAICVGPQLGGVQNATFGNLTELIVAVLLIAAGTSRSPRLPRSARSSATCCSCSASRCARAGWAAAGRHSAPAPRASIPGPWSWPSRASECRRSSWRRRRVYPPATARTCPPAWRRP